jgi:alpha-glucosidase
VLQGKVGEYIMTARQKGDSWYVGGLTNWDARTADVDLSFLPAGNYSLEVFRDGVNADRIARDFVHEMDALSADRKLKIQMAPGGGFVVKLTPSK